MVTKVSKINTEKKIYYRHAEPIEKQINDVASIVHFHYPQNRDKYFYFDLDRNAKFIIEQKPREHDAPLERILMLPYMIYGFPKDYAQGHEDEYSCWYEMGYDDVPPGLLECTSVRGSNRRGYTGVCALSGATNIQGSLELRTEDKTSSSTV